MLKTIQKLKEKYEWARMVASKDSEKRHQNVREMLLGDMQVKVMQGIEVRPSTTSTKKCHCHAPHKVDGRCLRKNVKLQALYTSSLANAAEIITWGRLKTV